MSEDFKKKLKDYFDGKLSEEEKKEIEKELEKLEVYQEALDEELHVDRVEEKEDKNIEKRHNKMIKRGKWKARFHNTFNVLGLIIIITIVSSIITGMFYAAGTPDRNEVYRDVLTYSVAVRTPNISLINLNSEQNTFFTNDYTGDLISEIGESSVRVGEFKGRTLFNKLSLNPLKLEGKYFLNYFSHPEGDVKFYEWGKLEKVHEGTVAEGFISFDKKYETDEILQKFKDKNLELLWMATDTGYEEDIDYYLPIGFPYSPMWHQDDFIVEKREVKDGKIGGKIISETASVPSVEDYGSGELRNENFIKTLKLIQKYDSVSNPIMPTHILNDHLQYIEENGVKIYGMVVTGPSKEILKLKEEDWVRGIKIGNVDLWNINDNSGY